jgi:L1 cell adhesion molecule like protein
MTDNYSIGIDLGTTYSCVGVVKNNKVEIITNENGTKILPSIVSFIELDNNIEILFGDVAKNNMDNHPKTTIYDSKRLLGRKFSDPQVKKDILHYGFKIEADIDDNPVIIVHDKKYYPEEISSLILKKLKDIAETYLGTQVTNAVITVPAYFNDLQRNLTKKAGELAGLTIERIINEPTSACIAYGLDKLDKEDKNILIFDLGGGTLDVSILTINSGIFQVKATSGDTHLGGEDFDNKLIEYCYMEFVKKYRLNNLEIQALLLNKKNIGKLKKECELAKRTLSNINIANTNIIVDSFYQDKDLNIVISRSKFENICDLEFKRCIIPIEEALKISKLNKENIDDIVLIGGSTRIPKIRNLLKEYFNKDPKCDINPDEAVAYGASIQADNINKTKAPSFDLVLVDVTALTLGLEGDSGKMIPVIERNTPLPCIKEHYFSTVSDNQRSINIKVYEGERYFVKDNILLGSFELINIPPAKRYEPKIKVIFRVDVNGILNITAIEESTKNSSSININNTNKFNKQYVNSLLEEAEQNKDKDKEQLETNELKNKLRNILLEKRSKLDLELKEKIGEIKFMELSNKITKYLNLIENDIIFDIEKIDI